MSDPDDSPEDLSDDPFADGEERDGVARVARDFVRKAAIAGLGAIFMTEEGIRGLAGQLKLPKEALSYLLSQAEKTKDEIGRVVTEEIRRFLQSDKLRDEFLQLLSGMKMEIRAEVRFTPHAKTDEQASKPAVTVTELRARPGRKAKKE